MPYITQTDRNMIEDLLATQGWTEKIATSPGQLNYHITKLVQIHMGTPSYARINEVVGVLEAVKLELYRRMAAPYEDKKLKENGDVYEYL